MGVSKLKHRGKKGRNSKMGSNEQFGDQEYVTKKETDNWNRKGLVQTKKDDQTNRQWKGFCRDQNVKVFKDTTTPHVKYTNRVYNAWDITQECNQKFQEFQN